MNHEYSTILLVIIFSFVFVVVIVNGILSGDVDEICSTDGKILKRVAGVWNCSDDLTGAAAIGNPFNQSLNTTDNVKFSQVYITNSINGTGKISIKRTWSDGAAFNTISSSGDYSVFLFEKNGGLRIGEIDAKNYEAIQMGGASAAFGYDTTAKGYAAMSIGYQTNATGDYCFAGGRLSKCTTSYSFAFGDGSQATGSQAIALGDNTFVTGNWATGIGNNQNIAGAGSCGIGYGSTTTSDYATAIGYNSKVVGVSTGNGATAIGYYAIANTTKATGAAAIGAVSIGVNTYAQGTYAVVIGSGRGTTYLTELENKEEYTTLIGANSTPGIRTRTNNISMYLNTYAKNIIVTDSLEEDLRFPVQSIKTTGASNIPGFEVFKGTTYAMTFDPSTMEQGYISMQTPHGRRTNSDLEFHWHWSPSDNNAGSVVWCVEYSCSDINEVMPDSTTGCTIDASAGTAYTHQMTDSVTYTNTLDYSAMCMMRIFRNATDSRDTYGSDAYLLEFDVHYLNERFGR